MENQMEHAGFWIRFEAYLIDVILITLILGPLTLSLWVWEYFFDPYRPLMWRSSDFFINYVLPSIAIITFFLFTQATQGKMAISVKIVDAVTGEAPRPAHCVGRFFATLFLLPPLGLDFLRIAFDKKKQSWQDKLAGTVVTQKMGNGVEPVFRLP
ncbi:RDD family protein [Methylonatrum kenyense]|uniref:RDD family protein n=1 Tax=Methylonatrum kenyense TaxID=455253 RepID=UPI0020C01610|nr:RDD family protein [Methylonatrum kenyense]MCK8514765.1 RDD family protein [Methylonatrum kenyense]